MSLDAEFQWVEVGAEDKTAPQGFVRNKMMHASDLLAWRDRYNNTGVFATAYRYRTQDKKGDLFGNLYFDLDGTSYEAVKADAIRLTIILEALFGIKPEDLLIFFSGNKGIHIIVPAAVLGIQPHPHLNEIFKFIASTLAGQLPNGTLDTKVYDRVRLFRLPNSKHTKSGLYKVPLSYDELLYCSADRIRQIASEPRDWKVSRPTYRTRAAVVYQNYVKQWEASKLAQKFNRQRGHRQLDFTPPCVKHLILNGAVEGARNQTAAVLANHYKQRGYSEEHTIETLRRWNEKRVSPPMDDRELVTTVRSIYARDYYYGCTTLERLAPCDKVNCRFGKYKAAQ